MPPLPRRRSSSRWLVYLLRCADGSLYTGITNDLAKRLLAHAAGRASKYTRSRLPVALAASEPQKSKSAALKREMAIKRLPRAEKELLVAGPKPAPQPDSGSADYSIENGLLVFTAAYHLKRGFCCGSGCRHCPYDPKHVAGNRSLTSNPSGANQCD
jgi:predicted GIY-YIG superfamily endonuclease